MAADPTLATILYAKRDPTHSAYYGYKGPLIGPVPSQWRCSACHNGWGTVDDDLDILCGHCGRTMGALHGKA